MPRPMDIIDPKRDLEEVEEKEFDANPGDRKSGKEQIEIEQSKSSGVFYLVLGIIALVVATAFAVYILYSGDSNSKDDGAAASVTASVEETTTAATSATATITETGTSITLGSPAGTKTATASYSDAVIRVVNGNGKSGEASSVKTTLEAAGFKVDSIGNASRTYDQTTIYYASGKEDLANALAEAIKDKYDATTKESDSTVGNNDAVIALGSK